MDTDLMDLLDEDLKCLVCMQLFYEPVTTQCGHNFCSSCFRRWINQDKLTCIKCRKELHYYQRIGDPRINTTLNRAIAILKSFKCVDDEDGNSTPPQRETKKRLVTVPTDHFGPIPAENDPKRNTGVLVGETWETRLEYVQWGVHGHCSARIVGQIGCGAQSIVFSSGYIFDEDHGEWFLYTGSGGKVSRKNRRRKAKQSSDQVFSRHNDALTVSCLKGYPVRVIRSSCNKDSAYAPKSGYRYDGVYRVENCWRVIGAQGFLTCRYLLVRCDNEPPPWRPRARHGDRPRMLPDVYELNKALDLIERKESPSWDFDEEDGRWKWCKPPPLSRTKTAGTKRPRGDIRPLSIENKCKRILKGFKCSVCKQLMTLPVTTNCGHTFCKACLVAEKTFQQEENVMRCPECMIYISDWFKHIEVNRDMKGVIESLQCKADELVKTKQKLKLKKQ